MAALIGYKFRFRHIYCTSFGRFMPLLSTSTLSQRCVYNLNFLPSILFFCPYVKELARTAYCTSQIGGVNYNGYKPGAKLAFSHLLIIMARVGRCFATGVYVSS